MFRLLAESRLTLRFTSSCTHPGGWGHSQVAITANVTDGPLGFRGGATFAALVGQNVTLQITTNTAAVYTVGFA